MGSPIVVVEYDPEWALIFQQLKDFVLPVLGDLVVGIEHVGSTSVPGLPAKPIIDMDVVVFNQLGVRTAIHRLATLGYEHEGDLGADGREAFIPPQGMIWHHLYVVPVDNLELKRHILFRDYLRSHPEAAKAYGDLKRELAQRFIDNRSAYSEGKSSFVNRVLEKAGWGG